MTAPKYVNMNIPFQGFYNSWYSDAIDREEAEWAEYEAGGGEDGESKYAPELRLSEGELAELLFKHTDYRAAYKAVALEYVNAFDWLASDVLGVKLGLRFEAMVSPREYNFGTDRLFVDVPLKVIRALFAMSKADGHETLAATIKERFTSYDGFSSFYDNTLASWLAKPLREWDHNELGTLLLACLTLKGVDWEAFELELFEATDSGDGEFYQAWDCAVDWEAFERDREDLREDKEAEARADAPDYVPPAIRHPDQLDLPFGS